MAGGWRAARRTGWNFHRHRDGGRLGVGRRRTDSGTLAAASRARATRRHTGDRRHFQRPAATRARAPAAGGRPRSASRAHGPAEPFDDEPPTAPRSTQATGSPSSRPRAATSTGGTPLRRQLRHDLLSGGYLSLRAPARWRRSTCAYPAAASPPTTQAGMVSTWGLFDQSYGAFEARAKLPVVTVDGLQETLWLYPQKLTYGAWARLRRDRLCRVLRRVPGELRRAAHPLLGTRERSECIAYDCIISQNAFNTWGRLDADVDHRPLQRPALPRRPPRRRAAETFNDPFFIALTRRPRRGHQRTSRPARRRCPPPPRSRAPRWAPAS